MMKDGCDSDTVNKYITFSKNREIKDEKKIMSPELNFLEPKHYLDFSLPCCA